MLTGFSRHKIMWDGSIVHSIALGGVTGVQYLFSSFKYNHFSYPKLWLQKVCMNCLCAQTAGTQRQTWEVRKMKSRGRFAEGLQRQSLSLQWLHSNTQMQRGTGRAAGSPAVFFVFSSCGSLQGSNKAVYWPKCLWSRIRALKKKQCIALFYDHENERRNSSKFIPKVVLLQPAENYSGCI